MDLIRRIFFVIASVSLLLTSAAVASGTRVLAAGNATNAGYASQATYVHAILGILNDERAQNGLKPLTLKNKQSLGTATCVGSLGHSLAMIATGSIWHTNSSQPSASFPSDICVHYWTAGENVGTWNTGDETKDLININDLMMSEPHDSSTCASVVNHACNILTADFHHVGIGIVYTNGATWLTENFTN
jgi:uncharacterized protein YkwD